MTGESGTDAVLAEALARARQAWPRLVLDADAFLAWLAPKLVDRAGSAGLRIEALALAFACAQGDAAAIATFEREHGHDIDVALARLHVPGSAVADVRQRVLARLFAGPSAKIVQ